MACSPRAPCCSRHADDGGAALLVDREELSSSNLRARRRVEVAGRHRRRGWLGVEDEGAQREGTTRCSSPPDSSPGRWSTPFLGPTSSSARQARGSISLRRAALDETRHEPVLDRVETRAVRGGGTGTRTPRRGYADRPGVSPRGSISSCSSLSRAARPDPRPCPRSARTTMDFPAPEGPNDRR